MSPVKKAILRDIAGKQPKTVSQALLQCFGAPQRRNKPSPLVYTKGPRSPHIDIINRELCDEIIQYLAPSLESYKGCTIIDVHPGACQWSASLHDFLQPKRHLLMEPEEKYLPKFIQPLLDQPGSTYRYTTLAGAHPKSYWQNYTSILEDGKWIEPRPHLSPDDPKLRQLDTSILITGNLARRYPDVQRGPHPVAFAPLILQHLTWASLTNSIFHRSGLVRMLWWVPDNLKAVIMSPTVTNRNNLNTGLSIGADLREIVGVQPNYDVYRGSSGRSVARSSYLLEDSIRVVRQRMAEDGVEAPENRALLYHVEGEETTPRDVKSPLDIPDENPEHFQQAIDAFETRCGDVIEAYAAHARDDKSAKKAARIAAKNSAKDRIMSAFVPSIEYPQSHEVIVTLRPNVTTWKSAIDLDLLLRLLNLEARFCALREKGYRIEPLKSRLLAADNRLREYMSAYNLLLFDNLEQRLEDQMAYFAKPQALPLDRRRFEPLQAQAADFWPAVPLALLDVTPVTGRDLAVPGLAPRQEAVHTCQQLVKYLFQFKTQPLSWVLDRIAPNAGQDLIPMIPELTDPRKGGRLDPNKVKVRMLSDDMLLGLVKAWYEWPFRPTTWELERATFSYDGGAEAVPTSTEAVDAENSENSDS